MTDNNNDAIHAVYAGAPTPSEALTTTDRGRIPGLDNEQWQKLIALLDSEKNTSNEKLTGRHRFTEWLLDTGASQHMTGCLALLRDVKDISPCLVGLPDGAQTSAAKAGILSLGNDLFLHNVLYVPHLTCTLISVAQMMHELDCYITFSSQFCVIQDRTSRTMIGAGEQRDGVYVFRRLKTAKAHMAARVDSIERWHQRLGHPSYEVVSNIFFSDNKKRRSSPTRCDVCCRAKQTRESFSVSNTLAEACFSLIHCDLWGPYRVPASCGAVYFLTIVDDFSRCVWIYLVVEKSEVPQIIKNFCAMVERQFHALVKTVRSDNGTEFVCLTDYFQKQGILHQTSCVGTPQQNGRVERKHRHILNVARALMFQACLPIKFWGECVLAAGYLINRTPTTVLHGKTPYEVLFKQAPNYANLRVFGSLCYAHQQSRNKDKFAERSRRCIFIGYPYGKKGWRLFDLDSHQYFVSRDVIFNEEVFPYAAVNTPSSPVLEVTPPSAIDDGLPWLVDAPTVTSPADHPTPTSPRGSAGAMGPAATPAHVAGAEEAATPAAPPVVAAPAEPSVEQTAPCDDSTSEVPHLGRGHRQRIPSVKLREFVTYTARRVPAHTPRVDPASSKSSGTPSLTHDVRAGCFSSDYRRFLGTMMVGVEPSSYGAAVKDARWRDAMSQEIQALEANGTWKLAPLPYGKKPIGCKWVYKIKLKADGSVERYKARLVVLGNRQVEGLDYKETFAPVAKMVTVRVFLTVAVSQNWELHQMDVHNAFLHGDLHEEVFMKPPPGFAAPPGMMCKLQKSLYGLRQAPRCWFSKLRSALLRYGFHQSTSDYSLFIYSQNGVRLHVLVYVDDLLISGNSSSAIGAFKGYLGRCFHMKDLGPLKYFLGIEVARGSSGLFLCQRKYAMEIVHEVGLSAARPSGFPIEQNHTLGFCGGPLFQHPERYRRLIGKLIYLTLTRPELSYCVHILAQFMQTPHIEHWEAALRVVRYLKGAPGRGIVIRADPDLHLTAYCDSDWASCPRSRRSLTGYIVCLGSSPISWKTKKQRTVSRSSAEAEYRSMATTVCELKWLKGLLLSFGIRHHRPMRLYCDNQSAMHIAANPVFHERTKHIEVDCHFVRDEITSGNVCTAYIHTTEQLADIFTKALGRRQFEYLMGKLGVRNLHAPT